jgi:uncharacterized protein YjbI with pentapeptide repeats
MAIQGEDGKLLSRPPEIVEQSSAASQTLAEPTTNPAEVTAGIPAAVSSVVHPPEKRRGRSHLLIYLLISIALCCIVVALIVHFRNWWSEQSQSLSGTVVDSVGASLPLSEVVITSATKAEQREQTDADGWFEFDGLHPGTYELTISHTNFGTADKKISMRSGAGYTLGPCVLHFQFSAPSGGRTTKKWNWRDRSGQPRSTTELNRILADHWRWLESGAPEPPNKNEDDDEIAVSTPDPLRISPGRELVGASLKNGLLDRAVLSRANLSDAHLNGAYLQRASLTGAYLKGTDLTDADLTSADLANAKMTETTILKKGLLVGTSLIRAQMEGAHLENTDLVNADMKGAKMSKVHLEGATLGGANLTGADLSEAVLQNTKLGRAPTLHGWVQGANLSNADLRHAQLDGTTWDDADVSGAVFEPESTWLPDGNEFAKALGLENLTYKESPMALVQIRKEFTDRGFDEQGRKITYAIMRSRAELFWVRCTKTHGPWEERDYGAILQNCGEYFLNRVFFDLPCRYGMSSGRTLRVIGAVWILCSFLNYLFIRFSTRSGLFLIPSPMLRTNDSEASADRKQPRLRRIQRIGSPMSKERRPVFARLRRQVEGKSPLSVWLALGRGLRRWLRLKFRLARAAVFFSLLSAFNIGYREFNLGRWLPSITRREYNLKAVGWTRVVAGWQALISVYLIAMWFLTYFGRPFD